MFVVLLRPTFFASSVRSSGASYPIRPVHPGLWDEGPDWWCEAINFEDAVATDKGGGADGGLPQGEYPSFQLSRIAMTGEAITRNLSRRNMNNRNLWKWSLGALLAVLPLAGGCLQQTSSPPPTTAVVQREAMAGLPAETACFPDGGGAA